MKEKTKSLGFQDEICAKMDEAVEICKNYEALFLTSIFYGISVIFWHSPEQVKTLADFIQSQIEEISKTLEKELKGKEIERD